MPTTAPIRAAIYVKEAAGYPDGENSKELHSEECEKFCLISNPPKEGPGDRP